MRAREKAGGRLTKFFLLVAIGLGGAQQGTTGMGRHVDTCTPRVPPSAPLSSPPQVHGKVQGAQLKELQEAAQALRKQQEEDATMRADMAKEAERLEASRLKFQRAAGRLMDIRSRAQDG